jgi:putative addiction module component (TIGR02574 family)
MKSEISLLVELGLTHLTRDVRLRLVHELIDSLAERGDRNLAPAALEMELQNRIRECGETPGALIPWETFKRQLQEEGHE